jgi:hypothetical protein
MSDFMTVRISPAGREPRLAPGNPVMHQSNDIQVTAGCGADHGMAVRPDLPQRPLDVAGNHRAGKQSSLAFQPPNGLRITSPFTDGLIQARKVFRDASQDESVKASLAAQVAHELTLSATTARDHAQNDIPDGQDQIEATGKYSAGRGHKR